ncbi:MAG: hypothetical protein CMN32_07205 [Saprospirales bacterium]|nr:hypothetical protein [Saprospirales bacterium]
MKFKFFLFSALFLVAFAPQKVEAQTADEIISNYYEVIGGVDAWKNLNSMKMTGSAENFGMTFPITVYSMRPNLQKVVVDIQGQQFVEAFDGEVAWTINPFMGGTDPVKKSEEETKEAAKQVFEDDLINYKEKGHSVSLEGKEEIDGIETFKLKLTKADGDEIIYFFDTENFVPVVVRRFISTGELKGKAVDTYLSDYDEVGGMMIPHSYEQKVDGQTFMKSNFTSIEMNPDISVDEFKFPEK